MWWNFVGVSCLWLLDLPQQDLRNNSSTWSSGMWFASSVKSNRRKILSICSSTTCPYLHPKSIQKLPFLKGFVHANFSPQVLNSIQFGQFMETSAEVTQINGPDPIEAYKHEHHKDDSDSALDRPCKDSSIICRGTQLWSLTITVGCVWLLRDAMRMKLILKLPTAPEWFIWFMLLECFERVHFKPQKVSVWDVCATRESDHTSIGVIPDSTGHHSESLTNHVVTWLATPPNSGRTGFRYLTRSRKPYWGVITTVESWWIIQFLGSTACCCKKNM